MKETIYDVAVIGGGPAGMMAAICSAELGASVILIEKNEELGKKLLITGGGRCNVTNATFNNRELAQKYGRKGQFLLSPLSKWSAQSTINFFESHGMPTKVEPESRVFPQNNKARSVFNVLVKRLEKNNVTILTDTPVTRILHTKNIITGLQTPNGTIHAKSYIIATGGTARPETGSTGEGFTWLAKLGHTISTPNTALTPVKISESWVKGLQGLALPQVKITIYVNPTSKGGLPVRVDTKVGKILFTHFGLSGPLVLNMSRTIGEAMSESDVTLGLDLFPTLDHADLDTAFLKHLSTCQNKKWGNALGGFFPSRLVPFSLELSAISAEIIVNKVPRVARIAFIKKLKDLRVTPTGLLGLEKAIVSSGGVALEEVDFKTMRSKKIPNLYLTGDVLDFDRPSGGFSLQICWTTGFVAGSSAVSQK